jgi:hypothetical protein
VRSSGRTRPSPWRIEPSSPGRSIDLRIDGSEAFQIRLIAREDLASLLVRGAGLGAHQRLWIADSQRFMSQIATVVLDDLVQMTTTLLANGESVHRFLWAGEKLAQLPTIGASARELGRTAKIDRTHWGMLGAFL